MESGKRKMTTTRRTPNLSTKTGSLKHTPINVINDQVVPSKHLQLGVTTHRLAKRKSHLQVQQQQQQQQLQDPTYSNCKQTSLINLTSPIQVLNKTRSEPLKVSSTNQSELRKVNSENWTSSNSPNQSPTNVASQSFTLCDSNQHHQIDGQQQASILLTDYANDSNKTQILALHSYAEDELFTDRIKQSSDHVDHSLEVEGTEKEVQVSPIVINISSDHVDHSLEVEGEGEQKNLVHYHEKLTQLDISDKSLTCPNKNKTNKVLNPSVTKCNLGLPKLTPSPQLSSTSTSTSASASTSTSTSTSASDSTSTSASTLTSASASILPSRSINKPTLNTPAPIPAREASNEYETHSKFQNLVDLVTWRDVSKSAFIFGIGTFIIISSSFAKDFNFSLISAGSYLSLVSLAVVFLYKSFMSRGVMDREDWPENYVWGEEEAIWFVKLLLPYLNDFLLRLRGLFSGDPAMTMKLAVVLFVLARCGSSITVWKMLKLGFFGVFVIPKLCSSYSAQITAYAKFWVGRFQDAWESCSHKKALAISVFVVVWNFCSVVTRAWAAFMLFVAFRYYQQSLITDDFVEVEEQTGLRNVQRRRHLARHRCTVPTSLDQKKQKKSF